MFTGLVEARGALAARRGPGRPGALLTFKCPLSPLELGESISVDGACLTVKRIVDAGFEADASAETLERTTLGGLAIGDPVNLERSMPLGARMGGHLVTGHVDATCTLSARRPVGESTAMTFTFPARLARLIAEKGSVAVSGISLTVNAVRDPPAFDVVIIPHTLEVTSLGTLAVGSQANLEVDLVARYVARFFEAGAPDTPSSSSDAAWLERLRRGGFTS